MTSGSSSVSRKLGDISRGSAYLILSRDGNLSAAREDVAQHMLSSFKKGIYVTLNLPADAIASKLGASRAGKGKFFFIDAAAKRPSKRDDTIVLENGISSLVELSLAMNDAMHADSFGFLIFDSVSSLLHIHTTAVAEKFLHYVIQRARNANIAIFLLAVEDADTEKILGSVEEFCDKCVHV